METTIPIYNLYYLLCYAWERLEERDLIDVASAAPPRDTLNLLGRVLGNGTKALIRRGFERGYREQQAELTGIRGKILFTPTVRKQLPRYGRAECAYDELEHDTTANRIIRATLTLLVRSELVEDELRRELVALHRNFRDVAEVRVTVGDCRRVVVHRNNRHYGFMLDVCGLILGMLLPDEKGSSSRFRDFSRDHQAMARLFEEFVRNFYRHHQAECGIADVSSKVIPWDGTADDTQSLALWPGMKSDICLKRRGSPLLIDCKYYTNVLKESRYGKETISSTNLYQVFTYTQNLAAQPGWESVEGLLLYAENGEQVEIGYTVRGRHLLAATVNLNVEWRKIHERLVDLVKQ